MKEILTGLLMIFMLAGYVFYIYHTYNDNNDEKI